MKQQLSISSLNPAQLQAATAKLGNLLILAGAGSGKTRVLVHRIEWLITEYEALPYSIFAVTFTNKAAAEMRERLSEQLSCDIRGMWIGTFHGLANRLLRRHYEACDLPQNFQVMDSDDQLRVIKRIFKKLSVNEERWEPKQAQNYINKQKDNGQRIHQLAPPANPFDKMMMEIYREYEQVCKQEGLLDFAELLLRSYELLLQNEDLRAYYQQKFKHFFVDEFQDTNKIQYSWLKILTENSSSVTVVGDDDQSIYGWRGACVENIFSFEKDYHETEVLRLEQNYRSTGTILSAANAVIAQNDGRFEKTLWTQADKGDPINLYVALNEEDEALYLAKQIQKHKDAGIPLDQIAILYRSNAQSRVLEEMLLRVGIEYSIYGGLRFFDRAEIKDALAYLRLVLNQHDNTAFDRAINNPPRGIGARSLEKIREMAMEKNLSYWDAAQVVVAENMLTGRATSGVNSFVEMISSLAEIEKESSLVEIVEQVVNKSGLIDFFQGQQGEKARSRVENLKELVNATGDFSPAETDTDEEIKLSPTAEFLSFVSLDAGSNKESKSGVQMMTIHSAKGLEFPIVFMSGVEEGLFPHHFSKDSPTGLEEERRLCYVGITRAKQKLTLSHAEVRRLFGREETRKVSRFITEIPSELIKEEERKTIVRPYQSQSPNYRRDDYNNNWQPRSGGGYYDKYQKQSNSRSKTPSTVGLVTGSRSSSPNNEDKNMLIGKRVKHGKFGSGTVIDQEGGDDKTRININFDTVGIKWLMLTYANLEVLS